MQTIRVRPKATLSTAIAAASWEPEGSILSCSVQYPVVDYRENSNFPLRDFLDRQWPQPETVRIIDAGSLTLDLDDQMRLAEVYIRTSPADWISQTLELAQGEIAEPLLDAPFEEDGHAKCQPIREEQYDAKRGIVCLSWGEAVLWCVVAPTLALGLAKDGTLMKIQMSEFWLPAPAPKCPQESRWERLKRRFG